MFILDTNVLSEEMRSRPAANVHAWLANQSPATLFTTAITEAELLYGVGVLPDGNRKASLSAAARSIMALFAGRVLPFDSPTAAALSEILVARRRLGQPIMAHDAQIAAIAKSRDMAVVTRDTADFAHCGIALVDPWSS